MQRNTPLPALAQWKHRLIAVDDVRQKWTTEQFQHCQIGFTVPAVRRRIDHHRSGIGPDDISGPQISVNAARRLAVVDTARTNPLTRTLDISGLTRRHVSHLESYPQERKNPFLDVERAPRRVFHARHRPGTDK